MEKKSGVRSQKSGCLTAKARAEVAAWGERSCRVCGCTENDCLGCVARTGRPCHWVADDLCSACAPASTWLIHVKRGNDNVARVRIGGKTYGASSTAGDYEAALHLAEGVALKMRADNAVVERYRAVSLQAGRGALLLTFKVAEGGAE